MFGFFQSQVFPVRLHHPEIGRHRPQRRRSAGYCFRRYRPRRPRGFLGSSVTHPIEYEPSPSKTGDHVVPPLTVFQTPPEQTAAKYWFGSVGFTAKSPTRPDINAGPINRAFNPANNSLGESELTVLGPNRRHRKPGRDDEPEDDFQEVGLHSCFLFVGDPSGQNRARIAVDRHGHHYNAAPRNRFPVFTPQAAWPVATGSGP